MSFQPPKMPMPPVRDPRKIAQARVQQKITPLKNPRYVIPLAAVAVAGIAGAVARWLSGNWVTVLLFVLAVLFAGLLAWLVYMVLSRERSQRLERGIGDEGALAERRSSESVQESLASLDESFERGLADLRHSRLSGDVYALPWYLVIGEPGTGKSYALHNSGLEIPAIYSRPQAPPPTDNLSWWFTNQAILLDTAGRYRASDAPEDHKEWRRLLRLLRQHRSQMPINGVVLALSARALLVEEGSAFEAFAHRLRRRLNEIVDELGIDPPIYLLITGADAIEGFVDFAGALPPAALSEAFGWTNSQRRFPDAGDLVGRGLEQVRARLDALLPQVLMREPDAARRRRIFVLPQEIEAVAQRLWG
jgi:type VI secretion system protein ImpL